MGKVIITVDLMHIINQVLDNRINSPQINQQSSCKKPQMQLSDISSQILTLDRMVYRSIIDDLHSMVPAYSLQVHVFQHALHYPKTNESPCSASRNEGNIHSGNVIFSHRWNEQLISSIKQSFVICMWGLRHLVGSLLY